jgi:hypothetical protein
VAAEDAADVAAENAAIEAAAAGIEAAGEGEGGAEAAAKEAEAAVIRAKRRRHAEVAATTLAPLLDQFDTALEASVPNLVVAKPWLADLLLPLQRSLHGMATSLGNWREKTPPQPHRPANLGANLGPNLARQVESAVSGTGDVVGAISGGLSPAASKRAQRGAKRGTAAPPSTAAAAGANASCIWEEFSTAGSGAGSSTSASRVNTPLPPRQARGSATAAGASAGTSGEGSAGDPNRVALPPGLVLAPQNTSEANARPGGMAIGAVPTTTLNLDVDAGLPTSPTGFPPRAASLNGTAGAAALSASWKLGSGVAFPGSRSMGSLHPPGSAVAGQYNESRRRGASPTPGLAQTYGRAGGNWRQQQQQQQSMAHSGWRGAPLMPPTAPILVKAPPNAFLPKAARESLPDFLHPYRY